MSKLAVAEWQVFLFCFFIIIILFSFTFTQGKVTNDNICAGTIHWMAPEVLRGEVATTKSGMSP